MKWFYTLECIERLEKQYDNAILEGLVGRKALMLSRLKRCGYRVPRSFVISSDCFSDVVSGLLAEAECRDMRGYFDSLQFPFKFLSGLRAYYRELGDCLVAVRSSSSDEDGEFHSFAGQNQSFLRIGDFDSLVCAIKCVWGSLYSTERMLYMGDHVSGYKVPKMAVIVQVFYECESGGVLFCSDPMDRASDRMVINSRFGGSDGVVSGKDVDSYVIDSFSGCILSKDIVQSSEKGVILGSLDDAKIVQLWRVGRRLSEFLGSSQDIEFGFSGGELVLFQSRPIVRDDFCEDGCLFSNVNVGEALAGVASPMTWTLGLSYARRGFERIFHRIGINLPLDMELVTRFRGRIYLNISHIFSLLSCFPFVSAKNFGRVIGVPDLDDYLLGVRKNGRVFSLFWLKLVQQAVHFGLSHLGIFLKREYERSKFIKSRDLLLLEEIDSYDWGKLKDYEAQLYQVFDECGERMLDVAVYFFAHYTLLNEVFRKRYGRDAQSKVNALISKISGVASAEPGFELLALAEIVKKDDWLSGIFRKEERFGDLEAFYRQLGSRESGRRFLKRFDRFLDKWGLRVHDEVELASARWRDDPRPLLRLISQYVESGLDFGVAGKKPESDNKNLFDNFQGIHGKLLKLWLKILEDGARLREEWRSYVVDILGLYRRFLLVCGDKWVKEGILSEAEDVFYLSYGELKMGLEHLESFRREARVWVSFRRTQNKVYEESPRYADSFILRKRVEAKYLKGVGEDSEIYYGLGASVGVGEGRACVVRSLEEALERVQMGDVLVTESTDVGWTPLFFMLSALVSERGGPLSHSSVVAREYGIPAVVGVKGIMDKIKDGAFLQVDGGSGVVRLK